MPLLRFITSSPSSASNWLRNMGDLITRAIIDEEWREYDFGGRVYRIENPKTLSYRPNGTTHRIVGEGNVVHCVPSPGIGGCVLRWHTKPNCPAVLF